MAKISELPQKTTVVDNDFFPIVDSEDVNLDTKTKRTLFSVVKNYLKAFFDTLYHPKDYGTFTGNGSFGGTLSVTGNTTMGGTLTVNNNAAINGIASLKQWDGAVNNLGLVTTNQTVDVSLAKNITMTLGANITVSFSNVVSGRTWVLSVKQDATGGRTITWTGVTWEGGTTPTLTTTANKTDIFTFYSPDGTTIYGQIYGQNF